MSKKPEIKLRVWWIPQVPMKQFTVEIPRDLAPANANLKMAQFYMVEHAKLLLRALADYDKFQLDNNIKPDYCNAGGLQVFEDGAWIEWNNEDGYDIDEILRMESSK